MAFKILILSDLNWHPHLRSISDTEVSDFLESDLTNERYQRISRYISIVDKENPEIVLLSGDITGDGSCGHGFQNALKIFFLLLETRKIQSYFISGNHDPDKNYSDLLKFTHQLSFPQEISNQMINYKGLNILGINFDCSASLTRMKQMLSDLEGLPVDICLAHSEIKRRIRLFETNASLIVTGHYDRKLMPFMNSIFISLDNDWEEVSYATAVFQNGYLLQASLHIRQDQNTTLTLEQKKEAKARSSIMTANGQPALDLEKIESYPDSALKDDGGENWVYLKHLRGINLRQVYTTLWKTKNEIGLDIHDLALSDVYKLPVTANYKISRSLMNDYLNHK